MKIRPKIPGGAGTLLLAVIMTGSLAQASERTTLRVVADIAPVHSLISRVMDGIGQPDLLIQRGASPHHYALRPSDAAALQAAELVIYVGAGLTPWLEPRLAVLAKKATFLELAAMPDSILLGYRHQDFFHEAEPIASTTESGDHDHAHGTIDPHLWLDPENARRWLDHIAGALSDLDPVHADRYFGNAAEGKKEITEVVGEIEDQFAQLENDAFIVFHDAYQYWEARFGFRVRGSILPADASTPSPKRLKKLRSLVEDGEVGCVLAEPQFDSDLIESVFDNQQVKVGLIDPEGAHLALGSMLYTHLLLGIAAEVKKCLEK